MTERVSDDEIEAVFERLHVSIIEAIERDEATDEQIAEVVLAVFNVLNVSVDQVPDLCEAMLDENVQARQRAYQATTAEIDRARSSSRTNLGSSRRTNAGSSRRADGTYDTAGPIKKAGRAVLSMLRLNKTPQEKAKREREKGDRRAERAVARDEKARERATAPKTAGLVGRLIGAAKKGMKMVFGKWRKVKNEGRYIPLSVFFE